MDIKKITYELGLKSRRRKCPITAAGITEINYKDVEFLKELISEKGKIVPKRVSGVSAKNQKKLALAIKRARIIALISFSEGYVGIEDKPAQSIYSVSTHSDITPSDTDSDTDSEDDVNSDDDADDNENDASND